VRILTSAVPRPARVLVGLATLLATFVGVTLLAQRQDAFVSSRDDAAILYSTAPTADRVDALNRKLADGSVRLAFDATTGYLRSALTALKVPVDSQVVLFSQNSSQGDLISMKNPRALYFDDSLAVGYVRGGKVLEFAAHDPRQGVIFYTLAQTADGAPRFTRNDTCLACHLTWTTLGVPGLFVFSMQTLPADKYAYASGFASDHRTSFNERWGGWYVTGSLGGIRHIGNKPISTASTVDAVKAEALELKTLDGQFDTAGYLAPHSDAAALLVLEHQTNMTNLITRLGWEARLAAREGKAPENPRVQQAAGDLADYMLFVYEVPLPGKVRGSSAFATTFAARGPADSKGRSLRQLDLDHRLMKYPCSYMIYSDAFAALPETARNLVYRRLWQVLSGQEKNARYATVSPTDRQAILEILRETKKDLPAFFRQSGPA
jgi:hypothetical protein